MFGITVVLASSLMIGLAPNAAKIAYQEGATPLAVITFRTIVGAIGIALYLLVRRQWPAGGIGAFRQSVVS